MNTHLAAIASMKKQAFALAAAAAMLAAPLGAAHAQSAEYRRGYDDGYRAGMDAARGGDAGMNGGGRRRIIIEDAVYGDRDGACDARQAVQAMVDRGRDPVVQANNGLCGDPAPRRAKSLEVTYRCGNGRMLRTTIREDTQAVLSCRG